MLVVSILPSQMLQDVSLTHKKIINDIELSEIRSDIRAIVMGKLQELIYEFISFAVMRGSDISAYMETVNDIELGREMKALMDDDIDFEKLADEFCANHTGGDDSRMTFGNQVCSQMHLVTSENIMDVIAKVTENVAYRILTESSIESQMDDFNDKLAKFGIVADAKFVSDKVITEFY